MWYGSWSGRSTAECSWVSIKEVDVGVKHCPGSLDSGVVIVGALMEKEKKVMVMGL